MNRLEATTFGSLVTWRLLQAELALGQALPVTWSFLADYAHFHTCRVYGVTFTGPGGRLSMAFAPKIVQAPHERQDGIVRHEIGHVVDTVMDTTALKAWTKSIGVTLPPKRQGELRADAIALAIWGEPLIYDEDTVQCAGTSCQGGPRPSSLGK